MRRRHVEKVEEWLDEACFVTELNALHEKYGIEKDEEGFFAYRKHLRTKYYQKLYTYGPTPDPLDEGCDCIFCNTYADPCRVRCADQPNEKSSLENGPHSGPDSNAEDATAPVLNQKKSAARRRVGNDQPGETADSADKKFTSVAKSYKQPVSGDVDRCVESWRRKKIVRTDRFDGRSAKKRARTKRKTGAIF